MLSISALIEFLLNLLRSDEARAEFENDPQGTLAKYGLDGVTAQDVRDATTVLGDQDGVSCHSGGGNSGGGSSAGGGSKTYHHQGNDPVKEIHHVTKTYSADETVSVKNSYNSFSYKEYNSYNEFNLNYTDNSVKVVNIDDRDTVIVGENVTVTDSFNGDSSANIVKDSFNSHEETYVVDSFNSVGDVTAVNGDQNNINDSFNSVGDVTAVNGDQITHSDTYVENSFNSHAEGDTYGGEGSYTEHNGTTAAENAAAEATEPVPVT
ncbi:MAG TPA: IniB N-terminal domain-containing protein [Egibacteraceae bacterium]|nr:IniB N-terminal domain-containing protein [Egibacteraceae bacterium]